MLNVSTTTVSNVIHGKTKEVSPANVERIRKVLDEYDYMPNINARNLASNRSKIIGMVVKVNGKENPFKDQFFGELLGAVEDRVRSRGYNLMVYALNDVRQVQKFILSWNMDGLVTCGFVEGEISYLQERYKKPIVIIDDYDTNAVSYTHLFLTRTHAAILDNTVSSKRETAVISRELKKEFQ